jgi:hypothetical protein
VFCSRCIAAVTLPAVAVMLYSAPLQAHRDESISAEPVDAVWRIQHLNFTYRSTNVYYSCDALQAKIGEVLRAVGAHRRVAVEMRCAGNHFVNFASARVTLAAPAEATRENVRAATTFDARTRLTATVRKIRLPTPHDIERFRASWQTVSLLSMEPGDCELLRGIHEQLFPQLSVRVINGMPRCSSFATKTRPKLEVAALMRMPPATSAATAH